MGIPNSEKDRNRLNPCNHPDSIIIEIPASKNPARLPAGGNNHRPWHNSDAPVNGIAEVKAFWRKLRTEVSNKIPGPRQIFYALAIVVLVICGFSGYYESQTYTRIDPSFRVDSIVLTPPNISGSQMATDWTMGISVKNSNKHTRIIYGDEFEATLFYETKQELCNGKQTIGPNFIQEPENKTTLIAKSGPCSEYIGDVESIGTAIRTADPASSVASVIGHDMNGIAHFDVKLKVRYRFVDPMLVGKNWVKAEVVCKDVKVISASSVVHSAVFGSHECRIQFSFVRFLKGQ